MKEKPLSKQRRRQLELRAAGRCQSCGSRRGKDKYYCPACREKHNAASKRWYEKSKKESK